MGESETHENENVNEIPYTQTALASNMNHMVNSRDYETGMLVRITNIIAKTHLIAPFSLDKFSYEFPFSRKKAFMRRVYLPFRNINFSIFQSGTIISRSATSLSNLELGLEWLGSILASFELRISKLYELLNIVSTLEAAPPLDLLLLAKYLKNCSYDPTPVLGEKEREYGMDIIVYYFVPDGRPRRTALIFSTGKIVLTGFNTFSDMKARAVELSGTLSKITKAHPEIIK